VGKCRWVGWVVAQYEKVEVLWSKGLALKSKVVERVTTSSLSIRIGVFSGMEPSLCTPKGVPTQPPFGVISLVPR